MRVPRNVFLVRTAEPESLLRTGLWTVTAASVGEAVDLLLTAGALAAWLGPQEAGPAGLASWQSLVEEARALAPVRVLTCETEVALSGLPSEDVRARVDGVVSLPSFWRELGTARVLVI